MSILESRDAVKESVSMKRLSWITVSEPVLDFKYSFVDMQLILVQSSYSYR